MRAKFIGETYGDYIPDRNYAQWDTGKGYDIKTKCEITKREGRTRQEPSLVVYDISSGLNKAYENMESVFLEWEFVE